MLSEPTPCALASPLLDTPERKMTCYPPQTQALFMLFYRVCQLTVVEFMQKRSGASVLTS